jgi:hypothetical protein
MKLKICLSASSIKKAQREKTQCQNANVKLASLDVVISKISLAIEREREGEIL